MTNLRPTIPYTGGCVCGAVRYECTAEPILNFKCHCVDCQHVTGGGHVAGFLVPKSGFRLTKGELHYNYTPSEAGGKHKRGYCPDCSSRLTGGENDSHPRDFIGVTAGTLDDASWFRPQMHLFTIDAQPWDALDPAVPQFEKYPPQK